MSDSVSSRPSPPPRRSPARHNRRHSTGPLLLAVVGIVGLCPTPVEAQTPAREPALVELTPGARALGLGAPQLGGSDPDLAFTHPALVGRVQGVMGGYGRLGGGAGTYTLATGVDWLGGSVAVSIHTLEYSASAPVPGNRAGGLDALMGESGTGVSESAATLTWGRSLLGVRAGASMHLHTQRYGDARVTGESFDVGVAHSLGRVQLALTARNLGESTDLPTEFVLGAGAYGQQLGPLDMGFATQLRHRDDGETIVGGGIEFGYWPVRGRTFVGRVGLRNVPEGEASNVTFGGSFWGDSVILDYAFQGVSGFDGIHRISVGWR